MKKLFIVAVAFTSLLTASAAYAQTDTQTGTTTPTRVTPPPPHPRPLEGVRDALKDARETRKDHAQDVTNAKKTFIDAKKDVKAAAQTQRDALQQQFEKARDDLKATLDTAKTPAEKKAIIEKMKNAHLDMKDQKKEIREAAQNTRQTLIDQQKKTSAQLREQFRGTEKQQLTVALDRIKLAKSALVNGAATAEATIAAATQNGKDAAKIATATEALTVTKTTFSDVDMKVALAATAIAKIPDTGEPAKDIIKAASQAVKDTMPAFTKARSALMKLQAAIKAI